MKDILKTYNCIIAGGCINSLFTSSQINDIDIYFRSAKDFYYFFNKIISRDTLCAFKYVTKKAITFCVRGNMYTFQAICIDYYENVYDIFKSFDFTVCMGAFDFSIEDFILHEDFLRHNAQRKLHVNVDTKFPITSVLRLEKYKDRGYSYSKSEMLKLLMAVSNLNIITWEDVAEQIGGEYGTDIDSSALNSTECNLSNIVRVLDNLNTDNHSTHHYVEQYNKAQKLKVVFELSGYREYWFVVAENNNFVVATDNEGHMRCGAIDSFARPIELVRTDVSKLFPIRLYKYVQSKEDGKNRKYELFNTGHEINIKKINDIITSVFDAYNIQDSNFSDKPDRALLECEIQSPDWISVGDYNFHAGRVRIKKFYANRIIHDCVVDGFRPQDEEYFDCE